ncbi:MAG: pantetheine-phosphate adenylyltransferase [Alphaproteobacteria bacterium]|nr:pantetheine-phosphate adenylyltransferase [Alphaproteobacteria bacterium]
MTKTQSKKADKTRIGLYPGTFDPITLGHMDIIQRAAKLVDVLVIGVAKNSGKGPLFDTKARAKMVEHEIAHLKKHGLKIEVRPFDNLLLHFAQEVGAKVIIRGLRAVSDFEYEFQMAGMNYRMNNEIETTFLMATDRYQFISSRFVKEIARLDGDVSSFASPNVVKQLKRRFSQESGRRLVKPEVRD